MCRIAVAVNRRSLGIAQRENLVVFENVVFVVTFKMTVFTTVGWRLNWVGEDVALCEIVFRY